MSRSSTPDPSVAAEPSARRGRDTWTAALTRWVEGLVPEGQWLPDRQPVYVASWIYVFGVACLASLVVIIASGLVLALGGVTWWHSSTVGHFVNSVHLWSVELFFATWSSTCGASSSWPPGVETADSPGRQAHSPSSALWDGVHRLSDPDELRLAVDLDPGEGRTQRRRDRCLLQRHEPRADGAVARLAAPTRRRRDRRRAHRARATPRRGAADRRS